MSDMPEKFISIQIDFGAGPHDRNIDLSDVEITEEVIDKLFADAKASALKHWIELRLASSLGRKATDLEVAAALGHLPAGSRSCSAV